MASRLMHGLRGCVARAVFISIAGLVSSSAVAAGKITYFHNDLAGSPLAATNEQGQVLWRQSYRPYGERATKPTTENDVWFTSRREDAETGLVNMGARYYDPVVGRFISMDPKGFDEKNIHSHNRYAYANNNPYRYSDPDGRNPVAFAIAANAISGATIGGGIAGVVNAGVQLYSTGTVRWSGIGGVADAIGDGAAIGALLGVFGAEYGGVAAGVNAARQAEAEAARDALSASLAPLKGKAPATVTGGYNTKTGEVAARACGGGKCAEDHVVEALGGNKGDVRFTEAVRPRTGEQVPICQNCESAYGRSAFSQGTRFRSDQ